MLRGAKVEVLGDVMLVYCRGALRPNQARKAKESNKLSPSHLDSGFPSYLHLTLNKLVVNSFAEHAISFQYTPVILSEYFQQRSVREHGAWPAILCQWHVVDDKLNEKTRRHTRKGFTDAVRAYRLSCPSHQEIRVWVATSVEAHCIHMFCIPPRAGPSSSRARSMHVGCKSLFGLLHCHNCRHCFLL